MTKSDKKNIRTFCIVSTLLIIAYVMRIIGNSNIYPRQCGILRAFIYIGLYIVWGFSLRNRIIQKQARLYMSTIAFLMVFWFLVRTTKYNFVSAELYPDISRYLWYLFYLPMLFIPMFAVFVALSMGNPDDYPLKKKNMLLYIYSYCRELFAASTVGVQVIDTDHKVFISSKTAKQISLIDKLIEWYDENDAKMSSTDTFKAGKKYMVMAMVKANEGYAFPDNPKNLPITMTGKVRTRLRDDYTGTYTDGTGTYNIVNGKVTE